MKGRKEKGREDIREGSLSKDPNPSSFEARHAVRVDH
jgi:hypothetical protein